MLLIKIKLFRFFCNNELLLLLLVSFNTESELPDFETKNNPNITSPSLVVPIRTYSRIRIRRIASKNYVE